MVKNAFAADPVTAEEDAIIKRINTKMGTWPEKGTVDNKNFACAIALKLLSLWDRSNPLDSIKYRALVITILEMLCEGVEGMDQNMIRFVCTNGRLGRD